MNTVVDAAAQAVGAAARSSIATDNATNRRQGAMVEYSSARPGVRAAKDGVAADDAVAERQINGIVNPAAGLDCRVANEDTVVECQVCVIINAAANVCVAIAHRKAGDGNGARLDVEDAEVRGAGGSAALNGQSAGI